MEKAVGLWRGWRAGMALLVACALAACASAPGETLDKALEAVGVLKKAENPTPPVSKAQPLPIRLQASPSLNLDAKGRSLGLWVRIYKLKQADAFLSAPYDTFGNKDREREVLGEQLLSVRDVQLVPGQALRVEESFEPEQPFVGVVGLFLAPAPQRWRYAFKTEGLSPQGLILGAHACALSVQQGEPVGVSRVFAQSTPPFCS